MSKKLAQILNNKIGTNYNNIDYSDSISLNCSIHGNYFKTVKQILYKNPNCPECTRLSKNKKLSEIGKTKVGELNSFYGHKHSKENIERWKQKRLSDNTKEKISNTVKSKECQAKTKSTNLSKYGDPNYVNAQQMRQTKLKLLEDYKDKYNMIEVKTVFEMFPNTKIDLSLVDTIIYKHICFIHKEDIPILLEKSNIIKKHAGMSKKEKDIVNYIKSFYNGLVLENKRKPIYPKELDIYLPDLNLAVEFNGNYYHSIEQGYPKDGHLKKSLLCKEKGIRLIHIYEFEDIEYQKKLLKSLILGKDDYNKLDFNKNNFITPIPKLYKNITNKGTIYSIGPVFKEVNN